MLGYLLYRLLMISETKIEGSLEGMGFEQLLLEQSPLLGSLGRDLVFLADVEGLPLEPEVVEVAVLNP